MGFGAQEDWFAYIDFDVVIDTAGYNTHLVFLYSYNTV